MQGPKEEPIFPGWVKALIPLAIIGVVAVLLAPAIGDIEIDWDELTETSGETVIDPPEGITVDLSEPGPSMLTSEGLRVALATIREDIGDTPQLTRLQLSESFADFHILRGDELSGRRYSRLDHGLTALDIQFVGSDPIETIAYPVARVAAGAPDRILAGLRALTGDDELELTSLDLRRDPVSGALRWEIVAGGEVHYALPDGSSAPTPAIPPENREVNELNECIVDARGDIDRINACFET